MTLTRMCAVCVAAALLAVLASSCASAGHAKAAAVLECSADGLHFSYRSHGATFSDEVRQLTVKNVACSSARGVAATVARRLLHRRTVPAQIEGSHVAVRSPCPSCTPIWHVTATAPPDKLIAFQVHGGA